MGYLPKLLTGNIDIGLKLAVLADRVVESHLLMGQYMEHLPSIDFFLVIVFLAGNQSLDLLFLFLVLSVTLFVLVLQDQITPIFKKSKYQ